MGVWPRNLAGSKQLPFWKIWEGPSESPSPDCPFLSLSKAAPSLSLLPLRGKQAGISHSSPSLAFLALEFLSLCKIQG